MESVIAGHVVAVTGAGAMANAAVEGDRRRATIEHDPEMAVAKGAALAATQPLFASATRFRRGDRLVRRDGRIRQGGRCLASWQWRLEAVQLHAELFADAAHRTAKGDLLKLHADEFALFRKGGDARNAVSHAKVDDKVVGRGKVANQGAHEGLGLEVEGAIVWVGAEKVLDGREWFRVVVVFVELENIRASDVLVKGVTSAVNTYFGVHYKKGFGDTGDDEKPIIRTIGSFDDDPASSSDGL